MLQNILRIKAWCELHISGLALYWFSCARHSGNQFTMKEEWPGRLGPCWSWWTTVVCLRFVEVCASSPSQSPRLIQNDIRLTKQRAIAAKFALKAGQIWLSARSRRFICSSKYFPLFEIFFAFSLLKIESCGIIQWDAQWWKVEINMITDVNLLHKPWLSDRAESSYEGEVLAWPLIRLIFPAPIKAKNRFW